MRHDMQVGLLDVEHLVGSEAALADGRRVDDRRQPRRRVGRRGRRGPPVSGGAG